MSRRIRLTRYHLRAVDVIGTFPPTLSEHTLVNLSSSLRIGVLKHIHTALLIELFCPRRPKPEAWAANAPKKRPVSQSGIALLSITPHLPKVT